MSATTQPAPPQAKSSFRRRIAIFLVVAICASAAVWWKLAQKKYPYGRHHACSKNLGLSLRLYANDHGGWYPFGGKTPEESLSLMRSNGDPYSITHVMRGKHLEQKNVDDAFARDGVLGPSSCGWHYVEGLQKDDSPQLAVAWDRVTGVNHFGQWSKELQCEIVRLDGSTDHIPVKAWPEFVEQQKKLLAETAANRSTNSPPIRWSDEETLGPNTAKPGTLKH